MATEEGESVQLPQSSRPDLTPITSGQSSMSQAFQGLSSRPPLHSLDSWTPGATSDADDTSESKPVSKGSNTDLRSSGTTAIPSDESSTEDAEETSGLLKDKSRRRKSIQVVIEDSGKKSKYSFTTNDPEFLEIMRTSRQREAEKNNGKPRNRPRDLVFTRQFTTFDRQNPSSQSPFHGFFTLFCRLNNSICEQCTK